MKTRCRSCEPVVNKEWRLSICERCGDWKETKLHDGHRLCKECIPIADNMKGA